MKNSKRILSAVLALATAACLGGCAQSSGSASSAGTAQKGPTKIVFYNLYTNSDYNKIYNDYIKKFNNEKKDVVIESDTYDSNTLKTKIKTLAAGNELPDMFIALGADLKSYYNSKLITPVNDIIDGDKTWSGNFYNGVFDDLTTKDGKIVGFPIQLTSTSIIFYNKKIFSDCGISKFPSTWDEFTSDISKIKAKGYTPIALGNRDKWVAESCYMSALGDRFTGSQWFSDVQDKKAKFTDPSFVDSLKAFQQLYKIGAFNPDLNSIDSNGQRTLYYKGKTGMFVEGGWAVGQMDDQAPADIKKDTELALFPAVSGGKGSADTTSGGAGQGIALNANMTKAQRSAATELIKYLFNSKVGKEVVEANGNTPYKPANVDTSKIGIMTQKYEKLLPSIKSYTGVYDVRLDASIIDKMNTDLQNMTIGSTTPEQAAQDIQDAADKVK